MQTHCIRLSAFVIIFCCALKRFVQDTEEKANSSLCT